MKAANGDGGLTATPMKRVTFARAIAAASGVQRAWVVMSREMCSACLMRDRHASQRQSDLPLYRRFYGAGPTGT